MIKTLIVLLALLISFPAYAVEVTDFPAETTPTSTDVLYLIKAGGGAGTDRQVTVGNISKGLTGNPTFTSVTVSKSSGVAGQIQLYNDYLEQTFGAILKGPTGTMLSAYTLQFPNAAPTAGQVMLYNTPMTWQTYGQGLGAATATTLTTTGIIDGKRHTESANGKTIDKVVANYVASGTNNFIVPTPSSSGGNQYCFKQATGATNVISVAPVAASGVMIEKTDGTAYCSANQKVTSGGAATDKLCLAALDATHYDVFSYTGSWSCASSGCTSVTVNHSQGFDTCSNGQNIATCWSSPPSNWTVSDASNVLTISTAGERATISCPGGTEDTGTVGLKITPSGTTTGSLTYNHTDADNVSYGMWIYVSSFTTAGDLVFGQIRNSSQTQIMDMKFRSVDVSNVVIRLYSSAGVNSSNLAVNNWYWFTLKWVKNGNSLVRVYNSVGALVGSEFQVASVDYQAADIQLGIIYNLDSETSILYMDDLWVDTTSAVFPLGP